MDYGFRQLDPVLGRWFCVDKMAESTPGESPYLYAGGDPVNNIDLLGLKSMSQQHPFYWKLGWDQRQIQQYYIYMNGRSSVNSVHARGDFGPGFEDWVARNTTTIFTRHSGGNILIDVLYKMSPELRSLLDKAVSLMNSTYAGMNVNLVAQWRPINSLSDILSKDEFHKTFGEFDSYVVMAAADKFNKAFEELQNKGWEIEQATHDIGKSGWNDFVSVINLDIVLDDGYFKYKFSSVEQRISLAVQHETGHPKFKGDPESDRSFTTSDGTFIPGMVNGHVPYTVMNAGDLWNIPYYSNYMILMLHQLHGNLVDYKPFIDLFT